MLASIGVLVASCGGGGASPEAGQAPTTPTTQSPSPSPSPTPTKRPPEDPQRGLVVTTADSEFGPMLFDDTGQAIYLFDKERTSRPECYDACAEAWPPVLTDGAPQAAGAARARLLGTTKRTDGSIQVTYAGHPLYYYAHEGKNQVLCHNVEGFGGLWLVVTPAGSPAD